MNASLSGGFADVPRDAARAFRAILTAMARPGEIKEIGGVVPPEAISPAAGAVIATLCDPETPLWLAPSLDAPGLRDWITFQTGAPFVAPAEAMFALGPWGEMPLGEFPIGTPEYPDRSTTLIVEMADLAHEGARLSGPGIKDENRLSLPDIAPFQANAARFPLGLDFIFTSGARLASLPRSTKVV